MHENKIPEHEIFVVSQSMTYKNAQSPFACVNIDFGCFQLNLIWQNLQKETSLNFTVWDWNQRSIPIWKPEIYKKRWSTKGNNIDLSEFLSPFSITSPNFYTAIYYNLITNFLLLQKQCKILGVQCSQETRDTFEEMMNFELFQNVVFIIFVFSNFCTSIGFNVPYVYLAAQAEVLHLTKKQSSWLLGIIGIANTVGRVVLGYFSDKAYVNRLLVYNLCLTACGVGEYFYEIYYSLLVLLEKFNFP